MKTNKMLRIASILLVAVMISTCAISGTFAKYITSDNASDDARVAKWGIVVTAGGTLFDKTYLTATNTPGADTDDGTEKNVLSVQSSDAKKLVAPGTKNENGITFSITGTAEVDLKVEVTFAAENDFIFLKDGTYEDMTTGDDDDYTLGSKYEPVRFTLKHTPTSGPATTTTDMSYDALIAALTALNDTHINANEDLGLTYGTYQITWEWAYENNDEADTILGSIAAGTYSGAALTDDVDYELDTYLGFTITVTQID